ncbi:MAG: metal-sulfur cluster assembly factor [Deltaproteobacteria bacterium]
MDPAIDSAAVSAVLRDVIDPEVGINVVDLGLVYEVDVRDGLVSVQLTMTSPTCPLGEFIVDDATRRIRAAFLAATDVAVRLVWDPPWTPARMSDTARRELAGGE